MGQGELSKLISDSVIDDDNKRGEVRDKVVGQRQVFSSLQDHFILVQSATFYVLLYLHISEELGDVTAMGPVTNNVNVNCSFLCYVLFCEGFLFHQSCLCSHCPVSAVSRDNDSQLPLLLLSLAHSDVLSPLNI